LLAAFAFVIAVALLVLVIVLCVNAQRSRAVEKTVDQSNADRVSGQLAKPRPIERVVPGFFNTFLFTYYASEYRHVMNGIEFCCETPVIERVLWPDNRAPELQAVHSVVPCRFLIRLPKATQTKDGVKRVVRNVMMDVPVRISLVNQDTIRVHSITVDTTQPIVYDSLAKSVSQTSLVGMIQIMFATFNRVAPLETNIPAR
jgi:hypothetical protein